jgi:hypothetical protein
MSQTQLTKLQIGGIAAAVALIFGGLLWKSASSKEEPLLQIPNDEPRDVTDELSRPSEASTVDLNIGNNDNDDDGWKVGTGGKKSRRRRRNKTRRSRSKSKRRTKK